MLCLALRSSAQQVYERARRQFSVEEISEAFAAARGLALPSQLRRALRADARDIHGEFLRLLPERPRPIKVQRWTLRRVAVALGAASSSSSCSRPTGPGWSPTTTPAPPSHVEPACDAMEPMWLQAQAVQTAQLVPCVASLPVGWSFRVLTVNNGRSTITLDHDRAGAKAIELRFAEACDTNGATEVASDVPGARRYERRPVEGTDTHPHLVRGVRRRVRDRAPQLAHLGVAGGRRSHHAGQSGDRLRHPHRAGPGARRTLGRTTPSGPTVLTSLAHRSPTIGRSSAMTVRDLLPGACSARSTSRGLAPAP